MFFTFLVFSFVFHWYPYVYSWASPDQPTAPVYILISRDLFFIVLVAVYLYRLSRSGLIATGIDWQPVKAVLAIHFVLFGVILLGAFRTPLPEVLQHNVRNLLMYVLIVPIYFSLADRHGQELPARIARTMLVMGALVSLFGIYSFFFMSPEMLWGGIRVFSLMGNPNTLGLFLIIPGLIAWALVLQRIRLSLKFVLCLAIAANITALVMTISFQAIASFVLAMALMAVAIRGWKALHVILAISGLALVTFIIISHSFSTFIDMWYFKLQDPTSTSVSGRLDQLAYVSRVMSDPTNWLIGETNLSSYVRFDSQYYNLIINNGPLALALYVMAPLYVIWIGLKFAGRVKRNCDPWTKAIYLTGVIFILVVTLVTANMTAFMQRFPVNMYYYLLTALVLSVARRFAGERIRVIAHQPTGVRVGQGEVVPQPMTFMRGTAEGMLP